MEYMDITNLKSNILKTAKELKITDLKPSVICFDGRNGIVELSFSEEWDVLKPNEKYHLLNYFLHNLKNEFDDYVKDVIEFKVGKND